MSTVGNDDTNGAKESLRNGSAGDKVEVKPSAFTPKEVLKSGRFACVRGQVHGEDTLMLLERDEFTPSDLLSDSYSGSEVSSERIFHNDIYSRHVMYPKPPANGVKTTMISPCTQKHIDKYKEHKSYMILETPQIYQEITLPHLQRDQFNLQWLYNVFSGEKEADRVLHRDNEEDDKGFMLLPDLHWDGLNKHSLHLLAIPFKRNIISVRDLNEKHLPLLYYMRDKSLEVVEQKYGFKKEHLRIYFHYQPTFYHLHVHITYIHHEAPGNTFFKDQGLEIHEASNRIFTEKAHLFDTVINNIELISNYYQRASIPFTVRETDSLFKAFKDAGILSDHILTEN